MNTSATAKLDGLERPTQSLYRELQNIQVGIMEVNPKDPERRAAAIELASAGLADLKTFNRKTWELVLR